MLLAFNTSLADLHIGLFSEIAEPLAEFHHITTADERHIHDMLLARSVSDLLDKISASAKDISSIVFINGPGSFTGLRIGLAFAKGLAFGSSAKLIPLIAHSVLLKTYRKQSSDESRIAILYPGYAKDSVYLSYSDAPEIISYVKITELMESGITLAICPPELDFLEIPHETVSISLQTMAEMALDDMRFPSSADLEPFYGTDFKPGK